MSLFSLKQKIKQALPRSIIDGLVLLRNSTTRIPDSEVYLRHVAGKQGIEIGGPSVLFKTTLPLYQRVGSLDGVNFSNQTTWEGTLVPGTTFRYFGDRLGQQFIADATDLAQLKDATYDFVLSSNCLEHVANPIKALTEWRRILKPNSALILVLPNKDSNFDHRRPITSFEHLLEDFNNEISEKDLTHLNEILSLHDLSMDPPAGSLENFKMRSLDNYRNRTLHHHVFDLDLMRLMLQHVGFEVIQTSRTARDFFALGTRNG